MNQQSKARLQMRFLDILQKTPVILQGVIGELSQVDAQSWRDGGDGWTVLEVVCHLRDYEAIFRERAELILKQDNPPFPVYDHLALVVEHAYNAQDLTAVTQDLITSRQETLTLFNNLQASDWQRAGLHASMGSFTMLDLANHIGWHDINHLEQMARIIAEKQ